MSRICAAEDYTLILGLPGTGKTSTIAVAVMQLLALGKSVLVTSYTNSALDNILLKLAAYDAPILRLGRQSGVHPAMKRYTLGSEKYPDTSATALELIASEARLVSRVPVIGFPVRVLCLSQGDGLIGKRRNE